MKRVLKELLLPNNESTVLTIPWGVGRGLRMPIDPQHQLRMWLGLYELEIARHLRRLVTQGMRCYDVGGQYGYDALLLARLSGGETVCFEADAALMPGLEGALGLNEHVCKCLTAVNARVGRGDDGTVALDEYAGSQPPDFIKVDVDGAELDVLRGANRILRSFHPVLLVETHSRELELACGRSLLSHGYKVTIVNQRAVLPDHRPIPHNRWLVAEWRGTPESPETGA